MFLVKEDYMNQTSQRLNRSIFPTRFGSSTKNVVKVILFHPSFWPQKIDAAEGVVLGIPPKAWLLQAPRKPLATFVDVLCIRIQWNLTLQLSST